ncbi:MAG: YtxH domain-containing protein [Chloroflexi bacterium]|nr:YtxH domain-containing protein [Chloroflexota bacterium]
MAQNSNGGGMSGLLVGFLIGAAVGATMGVLFAPKTGKETRHLVAERFREWRDKAGEMATSARERFRGMRGEEEEIEGA